MPYSKALDAITRVQALLDKMLSTDTDFAITPKSTSPNQMAYAVHQAISTSRYHKGYEKYSPLAQKWKIRPRSDKLIFELKILSYVNASPEALMKMVFDDIVEVTGIIGAMIKHRPFEGFFPDAQLNEDGLLTLHNWTSKNNYFIINHDVDGITVTEEDIGIAWHPLTSTN